MNLAKNEFPFHGIAVSPDTAEIETVMETSGLHDIFVCHVSHWYHAAFTLYYVDICSIYLELRLFDWIEEEQCELSRITKQLKMVVAELS